MNEEIKKRLEQVQIGEVPEGYVTRYKYICPNDWSIQKLSEITKRISIKNRDSSECPVYSINNQTGFIPQDEQFEQGSYTDLDKSSYKIVHRGQFAYNPARINVGSIGLLKDVEKAIVSSLYVCFAMKSGCDVEFFAQWIQTNEFNKEIVRNLEGSVREYLFYENFANINIAIPQKSEQRKIAEILNHCDRVIELKWQLIEEERKRKKWLMQNLFDPDKGIRLKDFSGKWNWCLLGKVGRFSKGAGISNDDCRSGQSPCIKYGDIYMSFGESFFLPVSHTEDHIAILSPKVKKGTLLFTASGEDRLEIGKCVAYLGDDSIAVGGDIVILHTMTEQYDSMFLAYQQYTDALIKQKAALAQGYSIVHLYGDQIRKLVISVPPTKEEQCAISSLIASSDTKIRLLEQELAQWQQKKKSLMQLLLSGLVRVTGSEKRCHHAKSHNI